MVKLEEIKLDVILRVVSKGVIDKITTKDCASNDLVKVKEIKEKTIIVEAQDGKVYEFTADTENILVELELTGTTKDFPPEARTEETRA
jgi:hypothetical protein